MEISVAEPEKRVVTSMKVQDTFIVYLVETRLVFCVVVSTVQNCMFTHDRNSKWFFYEVYFFFWQISNNDCINMYMVNFFIWLYAWLTFFSGCIYGLNFILVYRITDKNIKYNGDGTSSLWRRYSEFELLQNYLSITYPYIVVPPLPEKKVSTFICTHSFIQITGF